MAKKDEIRLTQLVCSRICHDLAGPAASVANGLEYFEDDDQEMREKAIGLVNRSSADMVKKVKFYRAAFGAGGLTSSTPSHKEVRQVAKDFFDGSHFELDWPDTAIKQIETFTNDEAKLLLNLILLGADGLPRGGRIKMRFGAVEGGLGVAVLCEGQGANLRKELVAGVTGKTPINNLTARDISAYLVGLQVDDIGGKFQLGVNGEGKVEFAAVFPR